MMILNWLIQVNIGIIQILSSIHVLLQEVNVSANHFGFFNCLANECTLNTVHSHPSVTQLVQLSVLFSAIIIVIFVFLTTVVTPSCTIICPSGIR